MIERSGSRRGVVVLVVVAVLVAGAVFVARARDQGPAASPTAAADRDPSGTPTPTTAPPTTSSEPPCAPRSRCVPPTTDDGADVPQRIDLSLAPAPIDCTVAGPVSGIPGFPDVTALFTAPTPQASALVPTSRSVFRTDDLDLGIAPIPGSDLLRLTWPSHDGGTREVIGRYDAVNGSFHRAISMDGCNVVDVVHRDAADRAGDEHAWALVRPRGERSIELVDLDLSAGRLAWAGRCAGCQRVVDAGTEVWAVGDPNRGPSGHAFSGTTEVLAIDTGSHAVRGPVTVQGSIVPAGGQLWMLGGDGTISHLDATTGATASSFGAGLPSPTDVVTDAVFLTDGRLWMAEETAIVAHDPISFSPEVSIDTPRCRQLVHGPGHLLCATAMDASTIEIIDIDPVDGHELLRQRFSTYQQYETHAGVTTYIPDLTASASGYWYTEQLPTPGGDPADAGGPAYLFHVDP